MRQLLYISILTGLSLTAVISNNLTAWSSTPPYLLPQANNTGENLVSTSTELQGELPEWEKIDPWVMDTGARGETEFLLYLNEQANLAPAYALPTKEEKGRFVFEQLRATANRTQLPIINELQRRGVKFRPFWIVNAIWVRGSLETAQSLARRSDIAHIYANPQVLLDTVLNPSEPSDDDETTGIEWNITKVRAPEVWAMGFTGQGVVIGGQDTGYDWEHLALKNSYRGWNGVSADHDYDWHDAIHSSTGICGFDSPVPCDDNSHGTHTMGTMTGLDGSNQIGMAPGARWIGCRNMNSGKGTPATYMECYEWFIAPTRIDGSDPDPSMAPDVINNSWSCPTSEGCTDPNVLLSTVNNVHAAGILTVHSAGNYGNSCGTISTPAAIYENSFTVGATQSNDTIASFSSWGPVTVDGSSRLKPDISAPGVSVRSSIPNNLYSSKSGTSMAAPHVAGQVALILSAHPNLRGQVELLEDMIEQSAIPRTVFYNETCGEVPWTHIPNYAFGWGRIDVLASILTHKYHYPIMFSNNE